MFLTSRRLTCGADGLTGCCWRLANNFTNYLLSAIIKYSVGGTPTAAVVKII
jgi:hypothetical protein